jgi:hypothetical protein
MVSIAEVFRSYGVVQGGVHVNGTDKETNHHYGDAYERLIPDRNGVKLMMEVGVADGSSLLAWRDVFPNALCVGFDVHHSDRAHGPRVEFHLGDATRQEDCERAAAGRQFDLIVEDASHRLRDTLTTLLYLWPFVKLGGLYVVEEFSGVLGLRRNIRELMPFADIVDTTGPSGGIEPLVALKKVWKMHA